MVEKGRGFAAIEVRKQLDYQMRRKQTQSRSINNARPECIAVLMEMAGEKAKSNKVVS